MITGRMPYEGARLAMARLRVDEENQLETALCQTLRLSASTLDCARVGIWRFHDERGVLTCEVLHEAVHETGPGAEVALARYPTYARALRDHRAIVADDARAHPATRELDADYLTPHGVTSMLDVPVYRAGEIVGVVCHEHVGPPRRWTEDEVAFASSVADLASILYEQADRIGIERDLRGRTLQAATAEKLTVLELLARAVAHDVNNVLTAIGAIGSQLQRRGDATTAAALHACADMGASLVRQLHGFASRREGDHARAPVCAVLERMEPILETLLRGTATLEVACADREAISTVSDDDLERIVLNLCLNARDAIVDTGRVRVALSATPDEILLEVADDGAGMTPEVRERIWEPHFTTKPSGTGLGLPSVALIAAEHDIRIDVDSAPGAGTTFRLHLPRRAASPYVCPEPDAPG